MRTDEISEICGISAEKLKSYEKLGLLPPETEGCQARLKRISVISSLEMAGICAEKIAESPVLLDESAGRKHLLFS